MSDQIGRLTNRQRLAMAEGLIRGIDTSKFGAFDQSDYCAVLENIGRLKGERGESADPKPAPGCETA